MGAAVTLSCGAEISVTFHLVIDRNKKKCLEGDIVDDWRVGRLPDVSDCA